MNVELLKKVRDAILEHPDWFDMEYWLGDTKTSSCGTTGCIAGWAVSISRGKSVSQYYEDNLKSSIGLYPRARDAVGLTEQQADKLFYYPNWPSPYKKQYAQATYEQDSEKEAGYPDKARLREIQKRAAQIAADRIDKFIESGGAA